MTNDRMADSSAVLGTITWAHPGDPHGSPGPGPKLSAQCTARCVQRQCARGPKLTRSPMECVRLCSLIKGGSHPFYHPPSFTAAHPFYHTPKFYGWYVPGVFVLTYQPS